MNTIGRVVVAAFTASAGGVVKCGDHAHRATHKLRRQLRQPKVLIVGVAIVDHYIAALDIAGLGQTVAEGGCQMFGRRTDR